LHELDRACANDFATVEEPFDCAVESMNDAENATNRRNPNREQRKHNVSQPQTTRTDNQKSRNKTRITQNQRKESNKPWTRRTEPRNETRTVLRVDQKGESLYQESRFRDDGHNH
jgi:hypothetical protein